MAAFTLRRYVSPLLHVLLWASLGMMLLIFQPLVREGALPVQFWVKQGVLFCLWLCAYYLTTLVWVPKLLFENRSGLFILSIIATTVVVDLLHLSGQKVKRKTNNLTLCHKRGESSTKNSN